MNNKKVKVMVYAYYEEFGVDGVELQKFDREWWCKLTDEEKDNVIKDIVFNGFDWSYQEVK